MRKKALCGLAVMMLVCLFLGGTAFAASTTTGLEVTTEITTSNGDTAYLAKVGETSVYIEVDSGGNIYPMDTANAFAATVCTVVDASGAELGTLESSDGVIDYGAYPDAAGIVCTTDFTGDEYTIEIADLEGAAISEGGGEVVSPSSGGGNQSGGISGTAMSVVKIITYVCIVIWVIIWIVTITRCVKDGVWGKKGRAKKCKVNGTWDMKVTTPHGESAGVLVLAYDGETLKGTLNDEFNKDSKVYNGKVIGTDAFDLMLMIDIGMGQASEFHLTGNVNEEGKMNGEMVLTAMDTIKSTFTAERRG